MTVRAEMTRRADEGAGAGIVLRNVVKEFGGRRVLSELDLTIAPGEFVAIVGRSGCGKSTLLRLLAGLEAPTSGQVSVGPNEQTRLMFQEARLLPWKPVAANVALGLREGREAEERVRASLTQVGLQDRGRDWPSILSGGQRQRVSLARALAASPRLLLLDEPLGALDALTRREMQELIGRLWEEQRFTAVLVTHDAEEATALADRVLVLDTGKVTCDLRLDLPRPRSHGTVEFAATTERILDAVLHRDSTAVTSNTAC